MANSAALLAAQAKGDPAAHRLATELASDIISAAPPELDAVLAEVG